MVSPDWGVPRSLTGRAAAPATQSQDLASVIWHLVSPDLGAYQHSSDVKTLFLCYAMTLCNVLSVGREYNTFHYILHAASCGTVACPAGEARPVRLHTLGPYVSRELLETRALAARPSRPPRSLARVLGVCVSDNNVSTYHRLVLRVVGSWLIFVSACQRQRLELANPQFLQSAHSAPLLSA